MPKMKKGDTVTCKKSISVSRGMTTVIGAKFKVANVKKGIATINFKIPNRPTECANGCGSMFLSMMAERAKLSVCVQVAVIATVLKRLPLKLILCF